MSLKPYPIRAGFVRRKRFALIRLAYMARTKRQSRGSMSRGCGCGWSSDWPSTCAGYPTVCGLIKDKDFPSP